MTAYKDQQHLPHGGLVAWVLVLQAKHVAEAAGDSSRWRQSSLTDVVHACTSGNSESTKMVLHQDTQQKQRVAAAGGSSVQYKACCMRVLQQEMRQRQQVAAAAAAGGGTSIAGMPTVCMCGNPQACMHERRYGEHHTGVMQNHCDGLSCKMHFAEHSTLL